VRCSGGHGLAAAAALVGLVPPVGLLADRQLHGPRASGARKSAFVQGAPSRSDTGGGYRVGKRSEGPTITFLFEDRRDGGAALDSTHVVGCVGGVDRRGCSTTRGRRAATENRAAPLSEETEARERTSVLRSGTHLEWGRRSRGLSSQPESVV